MATYYPASSFVTQYVDTNGNPLNSGTLTAYIAGTSTPTTLYTDGGGTPAGSTITLNSRGEPEISGNTVMIWLDAALRYKFTLRDSSGVSIWTVDNISVRSGFVVVGSDGTLTAENWDALYHLEGDIDFTVIALLGFSDAGDGGGGQFYWDSASTATHNIGTVVQPISVSGAGRWLRVYSGALDVKWFGAIPGADCLAGIVAATEAGESLELPVLVSAGIYEISDYIPMLDNMRLIGDGARQSVIQKASGTSNDAIINKENPTDQYNSFSLFGIGLNGDRVAQPTEAVTGALVSGRTINNIVIESCRFSESRYMGLNFNICQNVRVVNNEFQNTYRDSCGVWSSTRVLIEGNNFQGNDDDCISVNVAPTTNNEKFRQTNIQIRGNRLTDTGGIRCQRGKNVVISDNTIVRTKSSEAAIFVSFDNNTVVELSNPHSVLISNNVICDFIDSNARLEQPPGVNNRIGIKLGGMPAVAGSLAAPPKELDVATGTIVAPYSYNYVDSGSAGTDPIPRMSNIKVSDNLVVRTLPSGVDYSDWGYGEMFTRHSPTGWLNPLMDEDYMRCTPISVKGPVRTLMIQDNHFNATGNFGIWFDSFEPGTPSDNFDLDDVHIIGNLIKNTKVTAIEYSTDYDGTYIDVRVESNIMDCDPDLTSAGRIETAGVLTGGWTDLGSLIACNYRETIGTRYIRNVFKNCSIPFVSAGTGIAEFCGNVIEGQPAVGLFDVTNLGVGYVPENDRIESVVYRDSDPSSATYGAMLEYAVTQVGGASPPTQGFYIRGYFMPIRTLATVTKNGVSQAILGYKRLITGKNHVVGTDWQAVYVEL